MKKILFAVMAVLALATSYAVADRQYTLCDPIKSSLCGVASLYEFEEDSDYARTSETGSARLIEPDGADTNSAQWVVAKGTYGGAKEWALNVVFDNISFTAGNCTTATKAVTTNTWYFISATYTASTKGCSIKVNNGTAGTGTGTTHPVVNSGSILFGAAGGVNYGRRDEWFFYKRVLTSQQETDLYNSGTGRTYPF